MTDDQRVTLIHGDCVVHMRAMEANSVDAIVCDPPYALSFMGKSWDSFDVPGGSYGNQGAGATGRAHSHGLAYNVPTAFQAWCVEWAVEALRVAKPGAHLLAFGGTRMFHRLVCAIEDAGWEIRDSISYLHDGPPLSHPCLWAYGSGFPKSKNVALSIDKGEGLSDRGHRIATASRVHPDGTPEPPGENLPRYVARTDAAKRWEGFGTALKPAVEMICVARRPLIGTVVANVLAHGTGALNIDGCRVSGEPVPINRLEEWSGFGQVKQPDYTHEMNRLGRWPANLIHDGSDEVLAGFPQSDSTRASGNPNEIKRGGNQTPSSYGWGEGLTSHDHRDSGSASRFFYCSKASRRDREEGLNGLKAIHPTVKPTSLMRWLVRLVGGMPNSLILDPFTGSGSTGKACMLEGFRFYGIEQDADYVEIARRRIDHARGHRTEILAELDEEAALLGATTAKPVARQQPGLFDLF